MSSKTIRVTEFDLRRLRDLLEDAAQSNFRGREDLANLHAELSRAKVVPPEAVSGQVITMNSTVVLVDQETGEEETYTLVFPKDANITAGKISILAPIGTGMLGYEVGDIFEWPVPAGTRKLRVKEILYQPEAAGDYHL